MTNKPSRNGKYLAMLLAFCVIPTFATLAFATPQRQVAPPDVVDVRANQTTTADQQEPTLAVDPTNPNNVLVAAKDWRTGPKQVWYYRSTDGGQSWADGYPNLLPSELPNSSDPVLAFDASGTAYMVVLGYNQNEFSVGGVFVSRSTDAGATWGKATFVSSNSQPIFNDKEWLAVDRSGNPATKGNVYVSWTLFTKTSLKDERADIVVSRSTDGGKTFSPRQVVSNGQQDAVQGSYPVVGPKGELYVLYFNDPGSSGDNDIGSNDVGSAGYGIRNTEYANSVMQTSADKSPALFIVKSTDGGKTFGAPTKVTDITPPDSPLANSSFRIFVLPVLAVDPRSGALYATWNDAGAGNTDTMLASSTDGGKSWSAPRRVNDDPKSSRADQFFPTAIVGKDGTLHIMWLDRRDDPANKFYKPYYARSTDGGQTFTKNVPLSSVESNPDIGFEGTLIGDYLALDVSGDGSRFYAAWIDTRNGNQDIYYTSLSTASNVQVPVSTALPAPTPVAVPSPQPLTGFTDKAFISAWERPDRPVVTGKAQRAWVWGPVSFAAALEEYKQGVSGKRDVQYFDKARMEINNPKLDPTSPNYVTNGLLVVELISGRVQLGDAEFDAPRPPSQAPVAGDINSPYALTYASLASVASLNNDNRTADRTSQGVTATLNKTGQVTDDPTKANAVKLVHYEPVLGHNIPDVFWTFMNATGPVYNGRFDTYADGKILDWQSALGYPITEPYWTNVKIGGVAKSVLVQAFQRRVLTYVADNPQAQQVEMGNVGRHYFDWRYASRK